jgi:hypothetical protein
VRDCVPYAISAPADAASTTPYLSPRWLLRLLPQAGWAPAVRIR